MSFRWLVGIVAGFILAGLLTSTATAVAPTEEAIAKWKLEGVLEQKLAQLRAFKEAGGCSPVIYSEETKAHHLAKFAANADAIDTVHVVVILVDFADWTWDGQAQDGTRDNFDSILFSNRQSGGPVNPTGSMIDFYLEASYGKLLVHGEVFGWYRMPNTYAYYEGGNNGMGLGPVLAREAVLAADPFIDYSAYNNGGDMGVPIIVVHPGEGAETGSYGIWSHKSSIFNTPVLDGVLLQWYNVVPEEFGGQLCPIGVYCHEFGHTLGLPDLYDTDGGAGSEGVGRWSLMGSGNYNGGSQLPADFDPWCKRYIQPIPFLDSFYNVTSNKYNVAFPTSQYNSVVYQLKDSQTTGSEYWLVENRQLKGFDAGLPGGGLIIYHIDPGAGNNNNPARYQVAVEQADGLNSLAYGGSRGDGGDIWPGETNNRNFHNVSVPNSKGNIGSKVTEVGVWNISNSDSVMHADLDIRYSRPYITLTGADSLDFVEAIGDGDGLFEAGETIEFRCRIDNLMRPCWGWYMSLTSNNPDIEILDSNVYQDNYLSHSIEPDFRSANPVRFRLKPDAQADITTFTLNIKADSVVNSADKKFVKNFVFDKAMGPVSVLIVDDDNGDIAGETFAESFYRLRIPYHEWNKATQGSPDFTDLDRYSHIFWATGLRSTGGSLNDSDITALKAFLDGGGNLALGSAGAAYQLFQTDSVFMRDYLHTRYLDSLTSTAVFYWGVTGVSMTEGLKFRAVSTVGNEVKRPYLLSPVNGGQVAWEVSQGQFGNPPKLGNVGIIYSGSYKTVLTSFGFEYVSLSDTLANWAHRDSIFMRVMQFFGGNATSIDDPVRPSLPKHFTLRQNYPNPFNPTTTIEYSVTRNGKGASLQRTFLAVYNLRGQRVRTLVDKEQGIGEYKVQWDGTDSDGNKVASGVYLYRLERGENRESRKMVLLK